MTGTDIALSGRSELAISANQTRWTEQQAAVIRQLGGFKDSEVTDADLELFFHRCAQTGLDPFAGQISLVTYGGKPTIQVRIDGFNLISRRAADKAGVDIEWEDAQWCGPDGDWRDVWLSDEPPAAARVTLLRGGKRFPAVATFREFVGMKKEYEGWGRERKFTGRWLVNDQWAKRPAHMLAKCARAAAMRMAFPQDLGGVYDEAELQHHEQPTVVGEVVRATLDDALELVASATTYDELLAIFRQHGPSLTLAQRGQLKAACEARKAQLTPEPDPGPAQAPEATQPPPDEPVEGTEVAAAAQVAEVGRLMVELGYRDADQVRLAGRLLERPVGTLAELEPAEAALLAEQLTRTLAAPDPQGAIDLLLAGER